MDTTARPNTLSTRSYEDFIPPSEWIEGEGSDTLIIELPGFKKEQLKVQLDNYGNLRTSGERPLDGNRWRRFRKEFRVPEDINASEIRAKLEHGILTITLPKLITEPEAKSGSTAAPQLMPRTCETETDSAKSGNEKGVTAALKPTETEAGSAKLESEKRIVKMSETEADSKKLEKGKGVTATLTPSAAGTDSADETKKLEEEVKREDMVKNGGSRHLVGIKMEGKKRQLMINVAVAAIVLIGIGICMDYKFRKVAMDETGKQNYFEF